MEIGCSINFDGQDVGLTLTGRYVSSLTETSGNVMNSVFYTDLQPT